MTETYDGKSESDHDHGSARCGRETTAGARKESEMSDGAWSEMSDDVSGIDDPS